MKDLLVEAGVATARHGTFTEVQPALAFLETMDVPYVIKTDGLAAGKGVLVTNDIREAQDGVRAYLAGDAFGDAGRTLVIEEGLIGPEISIFAVCDGTTAVALSVAQDHKRIGDGDTGPNTGGMGAYTPVAAVSDALVAQIMADFVEPTLATLRARGIDYRGVLFAGLMLTPSGPKMLEYNVRFGDPEAEVVLPKLSSSLVELLMQAAAGEIVDRPIFSDDALVTVICASEGYPTEPRTGDAISGLDAAAAMPGIEAVFCAGVGSDASGALITAGGRVLAVTGRGETVASARASAYGAADVIDWNGKYLRRDIAASEGTTIS